MSPYVPISTGRHGIGYPEGKWLQSATFSGIYWYFTGLLFVAFATIPIAGALILPLDYFKLIYGPHFLFNLFSASSILSLPFLYLFLRKNYFLNSIGLRVPENLIKGRLEEMDFSLLVARCAGLFSEKRADFKRYYEIRYFNDDFQLLVHVDKDGRYAAIKLWRYRENEKVVECLVKQISAELNISDKITTMKELRERRLMEIKGLID